VRLETWFEWWVEMRAWVLPSCAAPSEYCAALGRKICSILRIRKDERAASARRVAWVFTPSCHFRTTELGSSDAVTVERRERVRCPTITILGTWPAKQSALSKMRGPEPSHGKLPGHLKDRCATPSKPSPLRPFLFRLGLAGSWAGCTVRCSKTRPTGAR
jgi:hypothetical protein